MPKAPIATRRTRTEGGKVVEDVCELDGTVVDAETYERRHARRALASLKERVNISRSKHKRRSVPAPAPAPSGVAGLGPHGYIDMGKLAGNPATPPVLRSEVPLGAPEPYNTGRASYFRDLAAASGPKVAMTPAELENESWQMNTLGIHRDAARERLGKVSRSVVKRDVTTSEALGFNTLIGVPQKLSYSFEAAVRSRAAVIVPGGQSAITLEPLPERAGAQLHLTKSVTGVTVEAQTAENQTLSEQDVDWDQVTVPVDMAAGILDMSLQGFDLGWQTDLAIARELGEALAEQRDYLMLHGSGSSGEPTGLETAADTTVTYTDSTPDALAFLEALHELFGRVGEANGRPPDTLILATRRASWLRKNLADAGGAAEARSDFASVLPGRLVISGAVTTTNGTGTNEDMVFAVDSQDVRVWMGEPRLEAFRSPLSATAGIRSRVYQFLAVATLLRPTAIGKMLGTGLVAPWA